MSLLQRISRFVSGGTEAVTLDATDGLRETYRLFAARARDLRRHAELAPQPYSTEALNELAAAEEAQAHRLLEALRGADVPVPALPAPGIPHGTLNHWGRLVQDLEAHRASFRRLRELAVHFAESLPSTAALFDDLCREELSHCERLRTLIARADPQALD